MPESDTMIVLEYEQGLSWGSCRCIFIRIEKRIMQHQHFVTQKMLKIYIYLRSNKVQLQLSTISIN